MINKKDYKLFPTKVVYEPKETNANVAIKNASAISAFEQLPVELHIGEMVVNVKIAKLLIERIR